MITTDEKILRQKCEPVKPEEVKDLILLLEQELENSAKLGRAGIGLAAPQIGVHKQIAIVRINEKYKVDLANCKITKTYDPFIFRNEGCLSFPDLVGDTKRYNEIVVEDNLVYPHSFIATGMLSVVVQHELDHISGVLLPDIIVPKIVKQPPNDPCACGKIDPKTKKPKKFKKCCGKEL